MYVFLSLERVCEYVTLRHCPLCISPYNVLIRIKILKISQSKFLDPWSSRHVYTQVLIFYLLTGTFQLQDAQPISAEVTSGGVLQEAGTRDEGRRMGWQLAS
jgi:hypothetical protein